MKILAIETSCDETSVALIEKEEENKYKVLAHETISQINLHREFGGVYPTLSRREHGKNLIPLLHKVLSDSNLLELKNQKESLESFKDEVSEKFLRDDNFLIEKLGKEIELLEKYPDLKENTFDFFSKFKIKKAGIDYIAVTNGPGLPPALWVGVNFAKIISILLSDTETPIPLYPINHMEGHIIGAISKTKDNIVEITKINYPVINLLISGGHTELVLSDKNLSYKKIGETVDDAVGECFDKVARMLNLPYPGGPEIGRLAKIGREECVKYDFKFPRPMLHSHDLNFSFSGLKTHVLYFLQKLKLENSELREEIKIEIATEFEYTVRDILIYKTKKAIEENNAQTLVVGGGVASSPFLREAFLKLGEDLNIQTFVSDKTLATDNALMIALCAANQIENNISPNADFIAIGSKNYEWK